MVHLLVDLELQHSHASACSPHRLCSVCVRSRGVVNRKWMIRFAIIESICAVLGFVLSAVSARFWTTMFLVFAVGCSILAIVLPVAGLFITAALGSSTKWVARLAYLTTWLFLLPCSVRYKVPFQTKANLIFMFVTPKTAIYLFSWKGTC